MNHCRNCRIVIKAIDYGMGPEWMHTPEGKHPYLICKPAPVATPYTVGDWAREILHAPSPADDAPTEPILPKEQP